jgi:hypothetical protein
VVVAARPHVPQAGVREHLPGSVAERYVGLDAVEVRTPDLALERGLALDGRLDADVGVVRFDGGDEVGGGARELPDRLRGIGEVH